MTPKNIVALCDGTNNKFGAENTNVLKMFSLALKAIGQQVVFYDPGVGTFSSTAALTPLSKWITREMGSMFGYGASRVLGDTYQFLVENYSESDRIYLFGFSRGAYIVRAISALIHACGLLRRDGKHLIPYAIELFKEEAATVSRVRERIQTEHTVGRLELPICASFAREFSFPVEIHFLGLWDTVTRVLD